MKICELFFESMQTAVQGRSFIASHNYKHLSQPIKTFILQQINGAMQNAGKHWDEIDYKSLPAHTLHYKSFMTTKPRKFPLVIMFSGGIDSTIAPYWAMKELWYDAREILLISCNYGQPYGAAEEKARKKILANFQSLGIEQIEVDFRFGGAPTPLLQASQLPQGYIIPMRNAMLAAIGSDFADNVWILANYRAPQSGQKLNSGVSDKSTEFFDKLSRILTLEHKRPVTVSSPVIHMSKKDTVEWLIQKLGEEEATKVLMDTVSCYGATAKIQACGRCYTCWKTAKMYQALELWDKFSGKFDKDPFQDPNAGDYEQREKNKGRE